MLIQRDLPNCASDVRLFVLHGFCVTGTSVCSEAIEQFGLTNEQSELVRSSIQMCYNFSDSRYLI